MSISVKLYKFSKRENSTAVPSGSAGTTFDCLLKDETSVLSPEILLKHTGYPDYNYAYIATFGRYYFIKDIISDSNDHWRISLDVDVLGSWKSNIGSASEYVLRAASDYDGDIIDNLYPAKSDLTRTLGTSVQVFDTANITYIIGILNNTKTDKFGAVKYYALDSTGLGDLMDFLLGTDVISETYNIFDNIQQTYTDFVTELQNGVARSLMNPCDYIIESYALPYTPTLGQQETLTIGWWPTTISAYTVTADTFVKSIKSTTSLDLDPHPQAATRGHYLSSSPYTRYWLDLGPFGIYPLDATSCIDVGTVEISISGDQFGNISCTISLGAQIIDVLYANVKNNFPIGQVSIDALGLAQTAIGAISPVGGIADTGADPLSIASGTASGILNAVKTTMPQVQHQGSQGSFINVFKSFNSNCEFFTVADDDNTHRGRPLCQVKTISSLSGYILVSDPDIAIPGTAAENEKIKNYMASGFYYE